MVATRANWKGFLKLAELTCPVALYSAASATERIAFHTLNRVTGHRVHRRFIDEATGKPVEGPDQVKGYEVGQDKYVMLEPAEIAAAVPGSDKTLAIQAFIPCAQIDDVYFDRPYYLAPADAAAGEAYALIREGMRKRQVAGLARTVLFRRVRTLLIRTHGCGLTATTLDFDYEVRSAQDAFDGIPELGIKSEMLDLAKHIIKTKRDSFDPSRFHDRYEAALAELVKAKLDGRPLPARPTPQPTQAADLMAALRQSATTADKTGTDSDQPKAKPKRAKGAAPRRSRKV